MDKTLAKFFYEQCAGSSSGHMASIPNNTVLYSLISAVGCGKDPCYAASQSEFAGFLRQAADALDDAE